LCQILISSVHPLTFSYGVPNVFETFPLFTAFS